MAKTLKRQSAIDCGVEELTRFVRERASGRGLPRNRRKSWRSDGALLVRNHASSWFWDLSGDRSFPKNDRSPITPTASLLIFKKLARSWRDDGNSCTLTLITVMAATPIFIG
jgi:hypothetical protein